MSKEQLKHLSYRRRPVSIVFCELYYLRYETLAPGLRRGDGFLFTQSTFYLSRKNPPFTPLNKSLVNKNVLRFCHSVA